MAADDQLQDLEWLRALAEMASMAIFVYRGNRFLYTNPATSQMSGYSREQLGRLGPRDLVHPDDWQVALGEDEVRRGDSRTDPFTARLLRCDGEEVWAGLTISSIELGEGRTGSVGTAVDLSEQKAVEDRLRRQLQAKDTFSVLAHRFLAMGYRHRQRGSD